MKIHYLKRSLIGLTLKKCICSKTLLFLNIATNLLLITLSSSAATKSLPTPLELPKNYKSGEVFVHISEPSILQRLENLGFSLESLLDNAKSNVLNNKEFYESGRLYKSFVDQISDEIDQRVDYYNKGNLEKRSDLKGKVGEEIKFTQRAFNKAWFKSDKSFYELVGVVNRLDRIAFKTPSNQQKIGQVNYNTCGEIRFIYRMAYKGLKNGGEMYSRLPLTINLVLYVDGDDSPNWSKSSCKRMATRWVYPKLEGTEESKANQFISWLVSNNGPLQKIASVQPNKLTGLLAPTVNPENFKALEINMQMIRIPSTIGYNMGGRAEYLLRAFSKSNDKNSLELKNLENTPDIDRINNDPLLKEKLFQTLINQNSQINAGTLLLPNEFLTKRASSFSPHGIHRLSNRPFDQIMSLEDAERIPIPVRPSGIPNYVKSPRAIVKRLNDLSCIGCHQGRAQAGFHFMGIDRSDTHPLNSLMYEGSDHFREEVKRRKAYIKRILKGLIPTPHRPFSIAPNHTDDAFEKQTFKYEKAGFANFCGLSEEFNDWQCNEGFTCTPTSVSTDEGEQPILGQCYPKISAAGDPCVSGSVTRNSSPLADDYLKEFGLVDFQIAKDYSCREPKGGFPDGMVAGTCQNLNPNTEVCGHFAGPGFAKCSLSGKLFEYCLDSTAGAGARGLCDDNRGCRNDYVCARTKDMRLFRKMPIEQIPTLKDKGICTPAYFLYQVRLDGHNGP